MSESQEASDLMSDENQSVSATYEGVHGHVASFQSPRSTGNHTYDLIQVLERQISTSETKSEEIAQLRVSESQLQAELEKKDEIIQLQGCVKPSFSLDNKRQKTFTPLCRLQE